MTDKEPTLLLVESTSATEELYTIDELAVQYGLGRDAIMARIAKTGLQPVGRKRVMRKNGRPCSVDAFNSNQLSELLKLREEEEEARKVALYNEHVKRLKPEELEYTTAKGIEELCSKDDLESIQKQVIVFAMMAEQLSKLAEKYANKAAEAEKIKTDMAETILKKDETIFQLEEKVSVVEEVNQNLLANLNESLTHQTIMSYNEEHNFGWDMNTCQTNGRAATAYCKKHQHIVRKCKTNDERFREVNSYPREVLQILFPAQGKVN